MEDVTVLSNDTLSKLSKLNYTRPKYSPEEEKEPSTHAAISFQFLCKVTQGGLRLKGGKHSLGFLFLYELFTRSPNLPLNYGCVDVAYDKPEVLGSLLLRLMPPTDTQTKGVLVRCLWSRGNTVYCTDRPPRPPLPVQMSILRQVEGGLSQFSRYVLGWFMLVVLVCASTIGVPSVKKTPAGIIVGVVFLRADVWCSMLVFDVGVRCWCGCWKFDVRCV